MDQTQIANVALTMMGQKQISIISENTALAIRCRNMWDAAWESFLEQHDWKFARETRDLAQNTDEPPIDYKYSYALPTDCLVPRILVDADLPFTIGQAVQPVEFDVVGLNIETDVEQVTLRYTANVTNHNLMTPAAVMAFAAHFAMHLSIGMTGSKAMSKVKDQIKEDLPLLMVEAIRVNDALGYKADRERQTPELNPYIAARQ